MRKTNVGVDTESVVPKVTPALEVVTHHSLNQKLPIAKLQASDIVLHVVLGEHLHNRIANLKSGFAAMLVGAHENCSCAKVIPCDLINCFTLSPLRIYSQAEYIIALGNGIKARLNKVNVLARQFTGDVAIQLKFPPGNDDAEIVEKHPHGSKGNEHNVAIGEDLTAKLNKFKEAEMVCILGIVVLAHKI